MELWVGLTLAAAFLQNARSALQKRLKTALGAAGGGIGATFARFGYGAPFAAAIFALAALLEGQDALALSAAAAPVWAGWTALAATAQIWATWALLRSFDFADFAVGTAFSKTEPLLAAAFGALLLSEAPTPLAALGLLVGIGGVGLLTLGPEALRGLGADLERRAEPNACAAPSDAAPSDAAPGDAAPGNAADAGDAASRVIANGPNAARDEERQPAPAGVAARGSGSAWDSEAAAVAVEPAPEGRRVWRAAFWGVAAAALFGLSAVGYRAASLSLDGGSAFFRAAATLLFATSAQALAMGLWMAWRRPAAWAATVRAWRAGVWIGAAGAAASAGWFWAMTLEPAAHVRALAQVELVFALAAAALFFGERLDRRKIGGVALIGLGAALLLLGAA